MSRIIWFFFFFIYGKIVLKESGIEIIWRAGVAAESMSYLQFEHFPLVSFDLVVPVESVRSTWAEDGLMFAGDSTL